MSITYEKLNKEYECVGFNSPTSVLSITVKGAEPGWRISVADKILDLENGKCNIMLNDCEDGEYTLMLHESRRSFELGVIRKRGGSISLPRESSELAKIRKSIHLEAAEIADLTERISAIEKCVFRTSIL